MQAKLGFTTLLVTGINIVVGIWEFSYLSKGGLRMYTLCPALVVYKMEWHRIVTSAYLHAGIIHLAVNMSSMIAVGSALEHRIGSMHLLVWICMASFLDGSMHCFLALLFSPIKSSLLYEHSLGFSGILFTLLLSEAWRSDQSHSLFGFFQVSAKTYPFVLLLALQILIPGVSFLGHAAGLCLGLIFYFFPPLVPQYITERFDPCFERKISSFFPHLSLFVSTPHNSERYASTHTNSMTTTFLSSCSYLCTLIKHLIDFFLHFFHLPSLSSCLSRLSRRPSSTPASSAYRLLPLREPRSSPSTLMPTSDPASSHVILPAAAAALAADKRENAHNDDDWTRSRSSASNEGSIDV